MNPSSLDELQIFLTTYVLDLAINALGAAMILAAGWWAAAWAARVVQRVGDASPKLDATLRPLAVSLTRNVILVITLLAVLGRFGVQTTSIVAIFGAAGLAIGLALQGTLSNVAAGVMLLVLRPFRVGESILVAGQGGTVKQVGLFTTELTSADGVFVSLPNSSVWNAAITNYSRNPHRRIDLTVGIGYDADIDTAIQTVREILSREPTVLSDPAVTVAVKALGESSVDLVVRAFVGPKDYWHTTFALQRSIKLAFDAGGISIPYPQRTVHMAAAPEKPQ